MVPVLGALRDRRVQPWDLEVRIRRRRPVALHVDQPRRGGVLVHAQGLLQRGAEVAGLLVHHLRLVLLALVVELVVPRELGLGHVLEERVVQHLVVDVELAHLGVRLLSALRLEPLLGLLLHDGLPNLGDSGGLDELRELEGRLLDAALAGHVLALAAPVLRDVDRVAVRLQVDQQARVGGCGVPDLDDVGAPHQGLQLRHGHAADDLALLLGQILSVVLIFTVLGLLQQRGLGLRPLLLVLALLVVVALLLLRLHVLEALHDGGELGVDVHACALHHLGHDVLDLDVVDVILGGDLGGDFALAAGLAALLSRLRRTLIRGLLLLLLLLLALLLLVGPALALLGCPLVLLRRGLVLLLDLLRGLGLHLGLLLRGVRHPAYAPRGVFAADTIPARHGATRARA
mmetsp:Transcript_12982/g.28101  ORF Transcript_12982/g.28101 Transcript_12982/m.28101 type:complete len:402 (-) Transcript_12982:2-1207(-)